MTKALLIIPAMAIILALASGCRVEEHKNGDAEDVKVATPFGGMSVKTDQSAVQDGVGLAVYPGATPLKENKDNGSADVNLSFGNFHLGVKAVSYQTTDSPDKVTAFYRKDMARYGAVILCRDGHAVGSPDHTQDGLNCNSDHGSKGNWDDGSKDELKAGSRQRQHIVGVEPMGSGTKIGLVALELPSQLNDDKSQD